MLKQIAIIFEGVKYFTFSGSAFITKEFPGTNVITQAQLMSSNAVMSEFSKHNNKIDYRMTPVAVPSSITMNNGKMVSEGVVTFQGKEYNYILNETILEIKDPNAVKESESKTEQEIKPTPEPENKPEPETENKPEPEPKPKMETKVEQKKPVNVQVEHRRQKNGVKFGGVTLPKPIEKKVGLQFGGRDAGIESAITNIGVTSKRRIGIVFGNSTPTKEVVPNIVKTPNPIPEPPTIETPPQLPVEPEEPKLKVIPVHVPEPEPIQKPVRVQEEPVTPKMDDAKQAAKQAVRKTLSDDVNAIIGDIPEEMLGDIVEFTSYPVNVERLSSERDMFCIDQRWHRQGKWYCIDVIPNTSRYFFNSRKNVSIEISIATLRAWKEALSVNV